MSHSKEVPTAAIKTIVSFFIILVAAFYYELPNYGVTVPAPKLENTIGTFYKVTKVVDGDTIQIDMNGNLEKVRLIGINTPETVDPRRTVECFGKEASKRMHDFLDGKIVHLEYDDTQGLRDTYDRILAYVYLEDEQMINRKMIAEGYAYEYTYMTPYKYQREFRGLQNFARANEYGLWSINTCNGSKILKGKNN